MKQKIIPVVIAVVLILMISIIGFKTGIMDKYSYSKEQITLTEYYNLEHESQVAVLIQDTLLEDKGLVKDGIYYLPLSIINENLNKRFYFDSNEKLLLYTMPTDIIQVLPGEKSYSISGEVQDSSYVIFVVEQDMPYVAIEFVNNYSTFSYTSFSEPNRLQINTEWESMATAETTKDTWVRELGGVKSPILADLEEGEELIVLEIMEKWSKVKTKDSIIGYVENKRLTNEGTKKPANPKLIEEPEYTSIQKDYKINLVWHVVTNPDANGNVMNLLDKTKEVNTISPTWFALSDNEGNIESLADVNYVQSMHERGIEVWALVDNFTKDIKTAEILPYTSKRTRLISELMNQVQLHNIDGINLDFEQIDREIAADYLQFIRELSIACRKAGIVFSIDNYVPTEYTAHYDREEQGKVADYIIIMGYDEHYRGSQDAGSVASIDFVDNGIKDTVSVVPKEKVINAIPFYTILWGMGKEVTSEAISMGRTQEIIAAHPEAEVVWSDETCQNYITFTGDDEIQYQIWIEDAQSLSTKLSVMLNHNIAGVAAWRMGLETEDVWDLVVNYINTQPAGE